MWCRHSCVGPTLQSAIFASAGQRTCATSGAPILELRFRPAGGLAVRPSGSSRFLRRFRPRALPATHAAPIGGSGIRPRSSIRRKNQFDGTSRQGAQGRGGRQAPPFPRGIFLQKHSTARRFLPLARSSPFHHWAPESETRRRNNSANQTPPSARPAAASERFQFATLRRAFSDFPISRFGWTMQRSPLNPMIWL
jgi:hypothetical protein